MKGYTDLEQSKKLAEFLPIESADMYYWKRTWKEGDYSIGVGHSKELQEGFTSKEIEYIPCWSLAALLGVLPSFIKDSIGMVYSLNMNKEYIEYSNPNISLYSAYIHTCGNNNLVDACYEIILKLHEQKLL